MVRFQNLYASEILTPAGLTAPTGFFGPATRAKANSLLTGLLAGATNMLANASVNTSQASTLVTNPPSISVVVPNATANPNDVISVYGYGFTPTGNTVVSNYGVVLNLSSSKNQITFRVRDLTGYESLASTATNGNTADVLFKIKNANGVSNEIGGFIYGNGTINQYTYTDPYADESTSTASTTSSDTSSVKGSAINSYGVLQQAASTDLVLQGHIQLINMMTSVDPLAKQTSSMDPIYSTFGGSGSSGGAGALGALGGAGALGGSGGGGTGMGVGGGMVDNFGGEITGEITECTCSGGRLFTVQDVRGQSKDLFYSYGASRLWKEYNLSSGVKVIGGYTPESTECEVYVGEGCETEGTAIGVVDWLRGVGTSLTDKSLF